MKSRSLSCLRCLGTMCAMKGGGLGREMLVDWRSQGHGWTSNLTPNTTPACVCAAGAGYLIAGSIMQSIRTWFSSVALAATALAVTCIAVCGPAHAAPCGGEFNAWLADFKREAASQGISQRSISSALDGVSPDPAVITRDHSQRVFTQTFE